MVSLKAIYSRSVKSAEAAAALTGSAPDLYAEDAGAGRALADLLARDDVSAVIIALPIPSQPEFVRAALAAGKHVLAEKPIAQDVATAQALIAYASSDEVRRTGATLSIAENQRYFPRFTYALEQAAKLDLGKVTHFSIRVSNFVGKDGKYYNTEWRKTPTFQGGFLLDGGVHFAAGARMLLLLATNLADASAQQPARLDSRPAKVSARTALMRDYLLPQDSVAALITTRSGATGTYQHTVGSHINAYDFEAAYENGSVRVRDATVTVQGAGAEPVSKTFERASGVPEEVAAWVAGLRDGKQDPAQSMEEALADLEFIEKMLQSGEQDGKWLTYDLQ